MAVDLLTLLIRLNLAAGLAIACVMVLRAPARRLFGPGCAYALWLAVPLASVAALAPARPQSPLAPPGLPIETFARLATDWTAPSSPVVQSPVAQAATQAPAALDTAALLLALWLVGAALSLVVVMALHRRSLAALGRLHPTGEAARLRSESVWSGPAVIGALRPRIVVPADFEDRFTPSERAMVLAHERVHLARADAAINAVVVLFQCLNWVNPLIHLGARRLRLDQEMACDAAVIDRHPQARRAYAGAMLKTQLAPLQTPLGCYWPAKARNPLKERFAMLKMKSFSRRRRYLGAAAVSLIVAGAGYGAWASNEEVRVATREVVEVTARPAPVLLTQAAPTLVERDLQAAPVVRPAAGDQGPITGRPLTETERTALDGARAGLAQAYEYQRLGVATKSALALQAARVAELEVTLGQKQTVADEALRLARADLDDVQDRYRAGLAGRSDIALAAERLVRLQLALGRQPTSADEALRLVQADIENAQEKFKLGLATRADIGLAAERLVRLQRDLGRQPKSQSASAPITLAAPVTGDFDADGKADVASIVATNGGYDLVIRPGDRARPPARITALGDASRIYLRKAKPGVEATSCAEGAGDRNAPCPRKTVTVAGDVLEFGTPEASRAVALWTGARFEVAWLDD